jgi:uncharacterized protein (TIGR00255 family)
VIRSMTAFARHEQVTELGTLIWEVRSVNHRYLELALRLEESFRPLEMDIRKIFAERMARGKIEASLRYHPSQQQNALHIDENLAQSVIDACEQLTQMAKQALPIDPLRLLQWPGVVDSEQVDLTALKQQAMDALDMTLADFISGREREGQALADMILQRCEEILQIAEAVKLRMPEILEQQRQRLLQKAAELEVTLEPERLEQEIVLIAQKSDVAEELDRLQSHVDEVKRVLQRDEPVGRRLDFLMQELNREANTLGSKSIDTDTTRYSVDLKVLIEQMREQIQNIE